MKFLLAFAMFVCSGLRARRRLCLCRQQARRAGDRQQRLCARGHASQSGQRRQADRRHAAQAASRSSKDPISTRSAMGKAARPVHRGRLRRRHRRRLLCRSRAAGRRPQLPDPVDAELEKPAQLQTRTIPVEDVLAALPPDPAVGIIILDACRDNPLARTLAAALPLSRSTSWRRPRSGAGERAEPRCRRPADRLRDRSRRRRL